MSKTSEKKILRRLNALLALKGMKIILPFAALVVIALIVMTVSVRNRTIKVGTTGFSFESIGELATYEAIVTETDKLDYYQNLFGWRIPLTTTKSIFSYDVVIKAGFDFSKIEYSPDVIAKTVTVVLPEVVILSQELDTDSLVVWDESKSIFTPLGIEDFNDAADEMIADAANDAVNKGLLENARENAEILIRSLLSTAYPLNEYSYTFK